MNNSPTNSQFGDPALRRRFRRQLLRWYDQNKRDLPWRKDRDPYRVWLSEIMLQQTRVAAVVDYYQRFLKKFPTVSALASRRLDSVLAAWSGLGYYRRARALHAAARKIVKEFGGAFPRTAKDLRALPGIGRYTAAAVASIAFNEPAAVVDGNVERVLQRVTGEFLSREQFWSLAESFLSRRRPGDFNQAIMELGATVCLPRAPKCLICPLSAVCCMKGEMPRGRIEERRRREICYSFATRGNSVFLVCRPKHASLMAGMWELPELTSPNGHHETLFTVRHSITVTDYAVQVVRDGLPDNAQGRWIPAPRLEKLPLTGVTRKILRAAGIIQ